MVCLSLVRFVNNSRLSQPSIKSHQKSAMKAVHEQHERIVVVLCAEVTDRI